MPDSEATRAGAAKAEATEPDVTGSDVTGPDMPGTARTGPVAQGSFTTGAGATRLASWHVSMISVGGIMGAGLLVGASATISAAGPAVLLSYLLAGGFIWAVMLILEQLAVRSGGRGSFISHVGQALGPRWSFVVGWSYAFLWIVTAGAQAVAGGMLVQSLCGVPALAGAVGFLVVALLLNLVSVRTYGRTESALSVLKLVALALFVVLCAGWGLLTPHAGQQAAAHLWGDGGFFPLGGWAVLAVIPMIVQTFTGCEIAIVAAADSDDPQGNIRRAVNRLPVMVLLFYFTALLAILSVISWRSVVSGQSPFLAVMRRLDIGMAEGFVVGVTLLAILSCLNSAKYVVSRVMNELAAGNCAPRFLQQANKGGVPVRAVFVTSALELLIVCSAAWSPSRVYALLLGASGSLIMIDYFLAALAFLHEGRATSARSKAGRKTRVMALAVVGVVPGLFATMLALRAARLDALLALGVVGVLTGIGFSPFGPAVMRQPPGNAPERARHGITAG